MTEDEVAEILTTSIALFSQEMLHIPIDGEKIKLMKQDTLDSMRNDDLVRSLLSVYKDIEEIGPQKEEYE